MKDFFDLCDSFIQKAHKKGITDIDVFSINTNFFQTHIRMQKKELIEQATDCGFGIRFAIGQKKSLITTQKFDEQEFDHLIERGFNIACASPIDPYFFFNRENLSKNQFLPSKPITFPSVNEIIERVTDLENKALQDPLISNSLGSEGGYSHSTVSLISSSGFKGTYTKNHFYLSLALLAEKNGEKQRDYSMSKAVKWEDLYTNDFLSQKAVYSTKKRLGARSIPSGKYPVIFDRRVASCFLEHFAQAINAAHIIKKTSFLMHDLYKKIFSDHITIIDDPLMDKGLNGRPFDAFGCEGKKIALVSEGKLHYWLTDYATSQRLKCENIARATRSIDTHPSPGASNLYMMAGQINEKEMIQSIKKGLYITDFIGRGVNIITGDYSRGASGYWIEDGEIAFPVQEITLSGNLKEYFKRMVPANNLCFDQSFNAPSLFVDQMIVAGQ